MKRTVGTLLILIGLMPIAAGLLAAFLMLSKHMYTVGLSVDFKAVNVLTFFMLFELSCLVAGAYLLRRPREN